MAVVFWCLWIWLVLGMLVLRSISWFVEFVVLLVVLGCAFGLRWMGLLVGIVGLGVGCGLDAGWWCV